VNVFFACPPPLEKDELWQVNKDERQFENRSSAVARPLDSEGGQANSKPGIEGMKLDSKIRLRRIAGR